MWTNVLRSVGKWVVLTAGLSCLDCSGDSGGPSSGGSANASTGGGAPTATGGASAGNSAISTGGSADSAGGTAALGGAAATGGHTGIGGQATGGVAAGGTSPTGGNNATGGTTVFANTGGVSVSGGGSATGGSVATVGGRGAGVCPGGTYPAPVLTGTPTRIYNGTASGQFEGTVWLSSGGVLLFSYMATNSTNPIVPAQVQRLTPPAAVDTLVTDSGTNGLALDVDGSLLGCSHKVQGIVRIDTSTTAVTTLLNTDSNGKHFNSPNDLTVRTDGTIYFTDPDYQLGSSRTSETGIKGVYRVTPSRQVSLVDSTFGEPNGIALSPDEGALYVADMNANAIRKFTVAADGSTSGKANFATVTSPDGVTVDCAGNTYWASNSAGKVVVLSPTGTQLGTFSVATGTTNVAFGGVDHKTLYISAGMAIYSLALNIPGFPY